MAFSNDPIVTPYGPISAQLAQKLANIKLLLSDVDGVLSDGKIYLTEQGDEIKSFNAKDGFGIATLPRIGIDFGVITGRSSKIVETRMQSLKARFIVQGAGDKVPVLNQIMAKAKVTVAETAYIGDDVIDIPVKNAVALGFAPSDAHPTVKATADYICTQKGGEGAVREVCDLLLTVHQALSLKGASI